MQPLDEALDGFGSCGVLAGGDGAVDGALSQGAWIDTQRELLVLQAPPHAATGGGHVGAAGVAAAAILQAHGGAAGPISAQLSGPVGVTHDIPTGKDRDEDS